MSPGQRKASARPARGIRTAPLPDGRFLGSRDGAHHAFAKGNAASATQWLGRAQHRSERRLTISPSLLLSVFVVLLISVTFQQEDTRAQFDLQSYVVAAGYSLAGLTVLFALGTRRVGIDRWISLWALVPIFITATAMYGSQPLFSLAAGIAHLTLLLFTWRMVNRLGHLGAVFTLIAAGSVIGALSIVAFYVFPDFGRSTMNAFLGDYGGRMRGVTPQPNFLGYISALTVLLAIMHFRALTRSQRVTAAMAIGICAFCLIASDSRTSILTLIVCIGMWWLCRSNAALNLFNIVGVALLTSLVIAFVPNIAPYVSREGGRTDDLASLDGRRNIWNVAWENIHAHPVLGQGYGSSRLVLPLDDRLFAAAVNTHNVYLEVLFSGGAVLFILFVAGIAAAIIRSAALRRVEALVMLLFFLIAGAAVSLPFSGLPFFPAFAFYVAVCLCLAPAAQRPQAHGNPFERRVNRRPVMVRASARAA